VSDYLSQLRGDLVAAHARYGRRSRTERLVAPLRPRNWRPATLLATLIAAACVVAGLIGVSTLRPLPPASIHVVARIHIGGQPSDAAAGFGYLWVADFDGSVIQVDPVHDRVVRRIPVGGSPHSIAAGAGAVWVTPDAQPTAAGRLVRIDPRTGRVTARVPIGTGSAVVAADRDAVWVLGTEDSFNGTFLGVKRVDPATGRTIATVRTGNWGDAAAVAGDALWTITHNGVLAERAPGTGRAVRRWALGAAADRGENVLAADANGVWVLRPSALVRVDATQRTTRRLPLPAGTLPVVSTSPDALWVAGSSGFPPRNRVRRLAGQTGAATGHVDLGPHQPVALVPSGGGLWIVTADGNAWLAR
jgi:hypothetical protein